MSATHLFHFLFIFCFAFNLIESKENSGPQSVNTFKCTFESNDCGIQNQYAISSYPTAAYFNWTLIPEPGMYLISSGKIGNGARLITPFFHYNSNGSNCLIIKYDLNGPGARKLKVAMQDRNTIELKSVTDKQNQSQIMKINVTPRSSPRFFITALFDANQEVDIAVKEITFTHSNCN